MSVQIQGKNHSVVDISPGGIAFISQTPFPGGHEVSIVYSDTFQILSNIIYCRVNQLEPSEGEVSYRIGANFVVEDEGFRIMVLVLEFYSARLNKSAV